MIVHLATNSTAAIMQSVSEQAKSINNTRASDITVSDAERD